MSQPVKLSDALVVDARVAAGAVDRSIAGQVEFWARLGRSVDLLLNGRQVGRLRRISEAQPLSELLQSVETARGRKRLESYLAELPFPHYRPAAKKPGMLERIEEDGTVTVGRFVNRVFTPAAGRAQMKAVGRGAR
jgi:hypothetical protein